MIKSYKLDFGTPTRLRPDTPFRPKILIRYYLVGAYLSMIRMPYIFLIGVCLKIEEACRRFD